MKLLTFLGTNDYAETNYKWSGASYKSAYSCIACAEFLRPEQTLVFLTKEASEKNLAGLKEAMTAAGFSFESIIIPIGKNETELWDIFDIITAQIPEESEIAFDITNGQRSLPLLGLLAAMFMKNGLGIKIKHMFYGAYNIDPQFSTGDSPIFDLSPMLDLLNWSVAADRFNRFGDSTDMADLLKQYGKAICQKNIGNEAEQRKGTAFERMGRILTKISNSYLLLRPAEVQKEVSRLKTSIDEVVPLMKAYADIKPLELLLKRIQSAYLSYTQNNPEKEGFSPKLSNLQKEKEMIFWYQHRGHVMQAISLAREWLLSWTMLQLGKSDLLNKNLRESINFSINRLIKLSYNNNSYTQVTEEMFKQSLNDNVFYSSKDHDFTITTEMIGRFTDARSFTDLWASLGEIRNDIDHAGHRKNFLSAETLIERSKIQLEKLDKLPMNFTNGSGDPC